MNRTVKFGYSEAAAIILVFMGAKAYLGYPRLMAQLGATAGWLIVILGGMMSMLLWLAIAALLAKFPGKSLTDISVAVLGPTFGLAANLVWFLYLLINTGILLRIFSDAVILTALPEVPISAISLIYLLFVSIAAYFGIEAFGRSSYISAPFIIIGTLAVLLSLLIYWDANQLLPILGPGVWSLLKSAVINTSAFGEVVVLAVLVPYFSFDARVIKKVGLFCIVLAGIILTMITIIYMMAFPMPGALENLAPFFQMTRIIYLGRFFQRFESLFILFWIFTAFSRLAAGILVSAIIFRQTFKLPYYRPLLPALAVLIYAIGMTPSNIIQSVELELLFRHNYGLFVWYALPAFIWAIALWKKKGKQC